MKQQQKKGLCLLLSSVFCISAAAPVYADLMGSDVIRYQGEARPNDKTETVTYDDTEYIKISHPKKPISSMEHDPKTSQEAKDAHAAEVHADGLLDYISDEKLGVPFEDPGAEGQGDRGQTYSWAGFAYGDWMYVSTLFNSTEQTGRLLGQEADYTRLEESYGGDLFYKEPDDRSPGPSVDKEEHDKLKKIPGSTLCKINVKTGEVKIIMSKTKNGLETSFRNAVEYNGKLYFCGSVNHLPSIFEIDPKTDAFQCVYQDPSIQNHPGGPSAAYAESMKKGICPTIRGLTSFRDFLVISAVGTDGNPYIAVSQDPSEGFTKIASTWADDTKWEDSNKVPAELLGYPACRLQDSIMGGSIWEMIEFNGSLYVAICTGTPENAPDYHFDENGNKVVDTMQSFALIRGDLPEGSSVDDRDAWTWTPIIGDMDDGAKYTFGIDPERTRSSACNMVVYDGHLYIGEYNDTQIAFHNMLSNEFDYLNRNLDQSVSLYRMDKDNNIEKVMGEPTAMFPKNAITSDLKQSGFQRKENQYIWQTKVFQDKLYLGTFDETMILMPLAHAAAEQAQGQKQAMSEELDILNEMVNLSFDENEVMAFSEENGAEPMDMELLQRLAEVRLFYEERKGIEPFAAVDDLYGKDPSVLLPEELMEEAPLVNVDSVEDLYLAMLVADDLMTNTDSLSTTGQLAAFLRFAKLTEQIDSFTTEHAEAVPSVLMDSAEALKADKKKKDNIKNIADALMYLTGSHAGFDLYVMEKDAKGNEVFKKVTDTGMGDVYNQGLRVFAVNDSDENPWLTIGTANPFYGTQIWRSNDGSLEENTTEPKQQRVKIVFQTPSGSVINRDWDKSDEIYVTEGQTSVLSEDVRIMVPDGYVLNDPQSRADIKEGTASVYIRPAGEEGTSMYAIAAEPTENGSFTVPTSAAAQETVTVQVSPEAGFVTEAVSAKTKNGTELEVTNNGSGAYTFIMPAEAVSVSVSFRYEDALGAHDIVVKGGEADFERAAAGTVVTVKAAVPDGMKFSRWTSDSEGVVFDNEHSRTASFVMPAEEVVIKAEFVSAGSTKKTSYPIHLNHAEGVTLTSSKDRSQEGHFITITSETAKGISVSELTVETGSGTKIPAEKEADGSFTFKMPDRAVTVTAKTTGKAEPSAPAVSAQQTIQLQIGNKTVYNNGTAFQNDAAPVIVNDRTMVPIRVITETLGGEVNWDQDTSTVTLNIDGKTLKMTVGQTAEGLDTPPVILGDRTFVPIRYIAEALGADVEWVKDTKQIIIKK